MIAKVIFLFIMVLGLGMSIADHGKERTKENGWRSFMGFIITIILLYYANFFEGII